MILEKTLTSTGASPAVVRYVASRRCTVEVIEGCNRTNPCMVTLACAPPGCEGSLNALALKYGTTSIAGEGITWTGKLDLEPSEEIWALFYDTTTADKLDLTVKAVGR